MKKHFCLSASFLLLLTSACKKTSNGPQMPSATHDGRRVVAWKLDGNVYVAEGRALNTDFNANGYLIVPTSPSDTPALYVSGYYRSGSGVDEVRAAVSFKCPYNHQVGQKLALRNSYPYSADAYVTRYNAIISGQFSGEQPGFVIVTYEDSAVIAGKFEFQIEDSAGKIHQITEGIFDIPKK